VDRQPFLSGSTNEVLVQVDSDTHMTETVQTSEVAPWPAASIEHDCVRRQ
jgi:hypothetical protein